MDTKVDLPDLEGMFDLIGDIHTMALEKAALDVKLKLDESNINQVASTDERFFINGKPPSQAYIDNTYKYRGFTGELIETRKRVAELSANIEFARSKLDLLKTMIDIWRTQEASERKATF